VAEQSFTDWECIVVDDGSEKPAVINSIAAASLGHKGLVIHQQNKGLPAARNRGLVASSGDYLLCLDSDDIIHRDYLATTVAALQSDRESGVVYCWTQQFGQKNSIMRPTAVEQFWLLQRNLIPVTSLFRRGVWIDIGGFDETLRRGLEDWEFWIRASLAGYRFTCVPEVLFYYRRLPGSMVIDAENNRVDSIHYIRNKHSDTYFLPLLRLLRHEGFRHIPRKAIARFWLTGIFFHYVPRAARNIIFKVYSRLRGQTVHTL
jgi:hypothetical protein